MLNKENDTFAVIGGLGYVYVFICIINSSARACVYKNTSNVNIKLNDF